MGKVPKFKTTLRDLFLMKGKSGTVAINTNQLGEFQGRGFELCNAKDMDKIPLAERERFCNPDVPGCRGTTGEPIPTSDKAKRALVRKDNESKSESDKSSSSEDPAKDPPAKDPSADSPEDKAAKTTKTEAKGK